MKPTEAVPSSSEALLPFEETKSYTTEIELSESASGNLCVFGWVPEGSFLSRGGVVYSKVGCAHPGQHGFCCYQDRQHQCPFFGMAKRNPALI